jgi:hypothetical protein
MKSPRRCNVEMLEKQLHNDPVAVHEWLTWQWHHWVP